jgi:hypothetical protein
MSEVTRILSALEQGDPSAAGEILPLVYQSAPWAAATPGRRPGTLRKKVCAIRAWIPH